MAEYSEVEVIRGTVVANGELHKVGAVISLPSKDLEGLKEFVKPTGKAGKAPKEEVKASDVPPTPPAPPAPPAPPVAPATPDTKK